MSKTASTPKDARQAEYIHLLPVFLMVAFITLVATFLGVLPTGMAGCFLFMIVMGVILGWIGDHTPIIRSYLGGGAIVCIFGSSLLVYFHLIPDGNIHLPLKDLNLVGAINSFFKGDGGFLDWYIAALITGSILGIWEINFQSADDRNKRKTYGS